MATILWTGSKSTIFNDTGNWNLAQVPGASDEAVIAPVAPTAVISNSNITISKLQLNATSSLTINGGTFFTINDGTTGTGITGTLAVANGGFLTLGGTIVNAGTISSSSTGSGTNIRLNNVLTTLTGGGKVVLSADTNNTIMGNASNFTLKNVNNTISGGGNIGNGSMVLSNDGTIDANQATASLTVNTGGNVITNTGVMRASAGGDLFVLSAVNNVGGLIEADGAGSLVFLQSTVTGGTVVAKAGGTIQASGASGVLDGLGLHPVTNAGPIQIANGQQLTLLGTVINNSSINLNATANATNLRLGSALVTLKGTGSINLTNNANNQVFGNASSFRLINQTNTITGAGALGNGFMTFTNAGLVDANQTSALVVSPTGNALINTGRMQSSNTGGLVIQNIAVNNKGGTIQALVAGSHVDLSGGAIQGGTLATAGGGLIQTVSGNGTLDGITNGMLTNSGQVKVNDQTILSLAGVINNTGTIALNHLSASGSTQLRIASQVVTLQGAGRVTMTNSGLNQIFGNAATNTLINVNNTISGAGQLGTGQLTLINQAAGTISADQAAAIGVPGQLILNTSGNAVTNKGLIRATNTGGLLIQNTNIDNAGGTVLATGAGAHVDLSGGSIRGGAVTSAAGGVIQTVSGNGSLDGITRGIINLTGTVLVNSQTILSLLGTINNAGKINLDHQGGAGSTQLRLATQDVVLQGTGSVNLSANALNQVLGNAATHTLFNASNTITGAGQLGSGQMTLVNQAAGVINANQAIALVLNTSGNIVRNLGTMTGSNTGGLLIQNTTVNNAGGTIQATGVGRVDLQSAYIEAGTLKTTGTAVVRTVDNGSVLDGITEGAVTIQGRVDVADNTRLGLVGDINNTGTISLSSGGAVTALRIVGDTDLQGGGKVILSDHINNQIFGTDPSFVLTNIDNVISGAGQLGTGTTMSLVNEALIRADQKAALVINTGARIVTNTGTILSSGTAALNGGLVIQNTTVNNQGGTIQATGAQGHVDLQSAYIEGGTIKTTTGGLVRTVDTGSTVDGVTAGTVTVEGTLKIEDHTTLNLVGTINNTGTILSSATSGTGSTTLRVAGAGATLEGTGKVTLTDNATNVVVGASNISTLINQGNTITGAGQFGNGFMEFINAKGTIAGTGANALVISLGSGNGVNEAGASILANGPGGVILSSGFFQNRGIMTANNGSALTFQSSAINVNLAAGDLVGGSWRAISSGLGAVLTLSGSAAGGGPLVNNGGILMLSGIGSVIQSFNTASSTIVGLEQTLRTVANGGQLQVLNNRGYTTTLDLLNSGLIQLGGGTFQSNSLTISATGRLSGNGAVNLAVTNAGTLEATGGLLTVTGAISGTGKMQIANASTLEVGGASALATEFKAGAVGMLKLDVPTTYTGAISGLILGDVINLGGVTDVTKTTVVGSTLTVQRSGNPNLVYNVAGTGLTGNHFAIALDGGGGTNLTLTLGAGPFMAGGLGGGSPSEPFVPPAELGLTTVWTGAAGVDFNNKNNWNIAVVPTVGDNVVIGAGFTVESTVSNTIDTLAIDTGSTLAIKSGFFTVDNGSGAGGLKGTVSIGNAANLFIGGSVANSGTISLNSTGTSTSLRITKVNTALTGGGSVLLSDKATNQIFASNSTFVLRNVDNKISGGGDLGAGQLTLVNETAGVITASLATTALNVNTGGNTIVNAGTMQALSGGDLNILSVVDNAGGTILASGAGSVVFLGSSVQGGSIQAKLGGVVQTSGASGTLDGQGLSPVTNSNALQVMNGHQLTLLGTITNNGTITLNSTGGATNLRIGSPIVTLGGIGAIRLSNNANNQIFGNQGAYQLINKSNTIDGAGALGASQMTLVNQALVDANQTTAMVLNTNGNFVLNTGTLQASNTGGLSIVSTTVNNTGGTVQALVAGSHVDLSSGSIAGGLLVTANGGVIQTASTGNALDGSTFGAITNQGTVRVNDLHQLTLTGTVVNLGSILLNQISGVGSAQLRLGSQTVRLQGGGKVILSNHENNQIFGNASTHTLVNVDNTISGAGQLGAGQMTLINQAGGTITADQSTTFFQSGRLLVNTSGNVLINDGLMQATGTGGMQFQNTRVDNSGGTLFANGAGTHVDLDNSTIMGGTLAASGGGVIQTVTNSTLDGSTQGSIANTGTMLVNDQTILFVAGTIDNTGTIQLDQQSGPGSTQLRIASQDVVLQGGGKVLMSNNINNQIFGSAATHTLFNINNTISGAGQLGAGQMTLINEATGTISADQTTALVVNTSGRLSTNKGLMRGAGTGGLMLQNTTLDNSLGTIVATGAGARVDLQNAYVEGGLLTTAAGGVIQTTDRSSALDGITRGQVNNTGTLRLPDATTLSLVGAINNTGTIALAAVSKNTTTQLRIVGDTTLSGVGKIQLSNNINNQIFGTNSDFQLINVDNAISGAGQIGTGTTMRLVNQTKGIITANQKTALVLNTGAEIVTNAGTMQAFTNTPLTGGLVIQNTTVNNAGGLLQAIGTAGRVSLQSASIQGGTLQTTAGSAIQTVDTGSTLDGLTAGILSNKGLVTINDNTRLHLVGTIANTGTIRLDGISGNVTTQLRLSGDTTLTGAGQILLGDNINNMITAPNDDFKLINQGNRIHGAGQFGGGLMSFQNAAGTIEATGTNALVVSLGGGGYGLNDTGGSIFATGAGGVVFGSGIITNNGTIRAGDGSSVTYQFGVINTNLEAGDLVGGTWQAISAGKGATISMTGGTLVTNAGVLRLQGAGSVIQAGPGNGLTPYTAIEETLTTITKAGQLQALGGRGYTTVRTLTNSGIIQLSGGTFQSAGLSNAAGGQFFGTGTVKNTIGNTGTIRSTAGALVLDGFINGNGILQADVTSTMTLNGNVNNAGTVVNNGTIALGTNDRLNINTAVDAASTGVFLLTNGSILDIAVNQGSQNKINFIGNGKLALDAVSQFGTNVGLGTYAGPVLQNFGIGDSVQLQDFNFAGAVIDSYTAATGLLQMHSGATLATLQFDNTTLTGAGFQIANDGAGHVLLSRI